MVDKCEICGGSLQYGKLNSEKVDIDCHFCGKSFKANTFCENGHYICDTCHAKDALTFIYEFCSSTQLTDPYRMADEIMKHPSFNMYGNEHHVLTPAVVLTTLKNLGCKNHKGKLVTDQMIAESMERASKIPGGWCGFYGSCGAGMGAGVAVSVFSEATPSTATERTWANKTTSKSLNRISDNLEHCCKRSLKISISEALKTMKTIIKGDCNLDFNPDSCLFSSLNDKCVFADCPYF